MLDANTLTDAHAAAGIGLPALALVGHDHIFVHVPCTVHALDNAVADVTLLEAVPDYNIPAGLRTRIATARLITL